MCGGRWKERVLGKTTGSRGRLGQEATLDFLYRFAGLKLSLHACEASTSLAEHPSRARLRSFRLEDEEHGHSVLTITYSL